MKMKNWKLKLGILSLCLCLAGCSVLSGIANWLPFGISVLDGVVSVVAPANTKIAADAAVGQKAFNDLDAGVAAAEAAGSGKAGLSKVIAEISSAVASQSQILADLDSLGVTVNAKDVGYATAAENLLIAALQGFEAELQAQAGPAAPPVKSAVAIEGDCFGFEPATEAHGPHAWANCDPSDPIDFTWDRDPQSGATVPAGPRKAPKLGSFKRQYNALCVKYGHPEKQMHLTLAEHLRLK
jgi:hypothetical protein